MLSSARLDLGPDPPIFLSLDEDGILIIHRFEYKGLCLAVVPLLIDQLINLLLLETSRLTLSDLFSWSVLSTIHLKISA